MLDTIEAIANTKSIKSKLKKKHSVQNEYEGNKAKVPCISGSSKRNFVAQRQQLLFFFSLEKSLARFLIVCEFNDIN